MRMDRRQSASLQVARSGEGPFEVVIMDLAIPHGMGGATAATQLRELDPSLRAIASSGYFNDPVMATFGEPGFDAILAKPYSVLELSRTVRRSARRRRSTGSPPTSDRQRPTLTDAGKRFRPASSASADGHSPGVARFHRLSYLPRRLRALRAVVSIDPRTVDEVHGVGCADVKRTNS